MNTYYINSNCLIVNVSHFYISFTLLFIFVQQVEAEKEEDTEVEYSKILLEYETFRYFAQVQSHLDITVDMNMDERMNTFQTRHSCKEDKKIKKSIFS